MTKEKVLEAIEALEKRKEKVTVRAVRTQLGEHGSMGDLGKLIREIKAERERMNTIRSELPQNLQDGASVLAMNLWTAAQELANRTIEDLRRGCEKRVEEAESQASEALDDMDAAELRIDSLARELDAKSRDCGELEKAKQAVVERASAAEARVAALEAEIRAMTSHAKDRERELDKAFRSVERMTALLAGAHVVGSTVKPPASGKRNGAGKPADHQD